MLNLVRTVYKCGSGRWNDVLRNLKSVKQNYRNVFDPDMFHVCFYLDRVDNLVIWSVVPKTKTKCSHSPISLVFKLMILSRYRISSCHTIQNVVDKLLHTQNAECKDVKKVKYLTYLVRKDTSESFGFFSELNKRFVKDKKYQSKTIVFLEDQDLQYVFNEDFNITTTEEDMSAQVTTMGKAIQDAINVAVAGSDVNTSSANNKTPFSESLPYEMSAFIKKLSFDKSYSKQDIKGIIDINDRSFEYQFKWLVSNDYLYFDEDAKGYKLNPECQYRFTNSSVRKKKDGLLPHSNFKSDSHRPLQVISTVIDRKISENLPPISDASKAPKPATEIVHAVDLQDSLEHINILHYMEAKLKISQLDKQAAFADGTFQERIMKEFVRLRFKDNPAIADREYLLFIRLTDTHGLISLMDNDQDVRYCKMFKGFKEDLDTFTGIFTKISSVLYASEWMYDDLPVFEHPAMNPKVSSCTSELKDREVFLQYLRDENILSWKDSLPKYVPLSDTLVKFIDNFEITLNNIYAVRTKHSFDYWRKNGFPVKGEHRLMMLMLLLKAYIKGEGVVAEQVRDIDTILHLSCNNVYTRIAQFVEHGWATKLMIANPVKTTGFVVNWVAYLNPQYAEKLTMLFISD